MKKKKSRLGSRGVLLVSLVLGLSALGGTYAAWSDRQSVAGRLTTGSLNMAFSGDARPLVRIAGPDGETLAQLDCEVTLSPDRKSAEVTLHEALPMDLLLEGCYLRLSYPIRPDGGTVRNLRTHGADFSSPSAEVSFTPFGRAVVLGGAGYALDALTEAYALPLVFEAYPALRGGDGQFEGEVYLALSPQSREAVAGLPGRLEIPAALFQEASPAALRGQHPDGVLVTYKGTVPIDLEQA